MTLLRELRLAARSLVREPVFALTVIAILGAAIGANTAIFGLLNTALLRAIPFDEPDRLVMGRATFDGRINPTVSGYDYYDYREQSESFEVLAATGFAPGPRTALVDGEPDRIQGHIVTWDLFRALRVRPILGRAFEERDAAARADVVVISYAYWQRRFSASPAVLGRSLVVDGKPATIVGVLPAGFHFMSNVDLWSLTYRDGPLATARRFHNLLLVGRLRPHVSLARAQAEVDVVSRRLEEQYADTNKGKALRLTRLHEVMAEGVRTPLVMLMGAVALVLAMACANVAGLLLVRAHARRGEVAIRTALGASRRSLLRHYLTESALLSAIACAVGLGVALLLQRLLITLLPVAQFGGASPITEPAVLAFAIALSMTTGIVFGVVPALRGSTSNPSVDLRAGGRTTGERTGVRLRSALVVVQVALGTVLLIGAGLLVRSLAREMRVDLGFDPANVLTAGVRVPELDYPSEALRTGFHTSLVADVSALPGVRAVGLVSQLPIRHPGGNIYIHRPGEESGASMEKSADFRVVLPGYLAAMRIPLVAGRDIAESDGPNSRRVMLMSRSLATLMFGDENPIGQTLFVDMGEPVLHEIVGVVGDARIRRVRSDPFHAMYMSLRQTPRALMFLTVRTDADPLGLVEPIRDLLRRKDPTIPLAEPATMSSIVEDARTYSRAVTLALGLFSGLAMVIAVAGLYGVLDYYVRQRRRELSVRVALGATRTELLSLVVGRGMLLAAAGLAAGTVGATMAAGVLRTLLYETTPADPATLVTVPALFGLVTAFACVLPAWRAARSNPAEALRAE